MTDQPIPLRIAQGEEPYQRGHDGEAHGQPPAKPGTPTIAPPVPDAGPAMTREVKPSTPSLPSEAAP